ncbi:MAG: hypothetical protein KJ967_06065 [Elusimicrobia bacterium]|nr:hypothetical protein [Elusimicrobiota bacterium]
MKIKKLTYIKTMNKPNKVKFIILIAVIAALIISAALIVWAATVTDSFTDTSKVSQTSNITVDTVNQTVSLSQTTWTCGADSLTDTRDSKTYATVLIGSQCWMAENINVGTLTAGAGDQGADCPSASEIEKYCYSDNESNCTTYGGLYQWDQTMCGGTSAGAQGICPLGWHIPTHDEFTTLELAVCTSGTCATDFPYDTSTTGWRGTNEGTKLKSGGSSGFNGLLSGYRGPDGSFSLLSSYGDFWSSVQSGSSAWRRILGSGFATVYRVTGSKAYGFSVRCLKD